MGLSFRKSITILPGVKVNLSKSGVSLSAGIGGLHGSINTKGQVRGTASIPGTGVRYTKTKKLTDLIPGIGGEEEKKKSTGATKSHKEPDLKPEKKDEALKRGEVSKAIMKIYAVSDKQIDWINIKNSESNLGYENWEYLKENASAVLDGDIDTYLKVIQDVNPFDELQALGSTFECGSDNPMKMSVECTVNADAVLENCKDDAELLADYVAGVALKAARDLFALLPLWQIEVTAINDGKNVLNVKFQRDSFEQLDFNKVDASDAITRLGGIIAV